MDTPTASYRFDKLDLRASFGPVYIDIVGLGNQTALPFQTDEQPQWRSNSEQKSAGVIWTSSLPYVELRNDPRLTMFKAYNPDKQFILCGRDCSSIIDSIVRGLILHRARTSSIDVFCSDYFGDVVHNSGLQNCVRFADWRNSYGLLRLHNYGQQFRLLGLVKHSDCRFAGAMQIRSIDQKDCLFVDDHLKSEFVETDFLTECNLLNYALDLYCSNGALRFVFTNRRPERMERTVRHFSLAPHAVFHSRMVIGHLGGNDILYNMQLAMAESFRAGDKVIISATGIGYTWCVAVFEAL